VDPILKQKQTSWR